MCSVSYLVFFILPGTPCKFKMDGFWIDKITILTDISHVKVQLPVLVAGTYRMLKHAAGTAKLVFCTSYSKSVQTLSCFAHHQNSCNIFAF
jgi:hypothetical protein